MAKRLSFNINVELYEDTHGDLALRFPGEKVYRAGAGGEAGDFVRDSTEMILNGTRPPGWREMPAHQLLYGQGWHCISRLGFIDGDEHRPAVEFEDDPSGFGRQARSYLRRVLH